jgi:hypothetical protein
MLDDISDKSLKNVLLLLTWNEAREIKDKLEELIHDYGQKGLHAHVGDDDYQHELTFSIYDKNDISEYNPRIRILLKDDK